MKILVTGAAGFIGSAFARFALKEKNEIIILDKLTYAGHIENIEGLIDNKTCSFARGDICDAEFVAKLISEHAVDAVVNFAAESHVDNSIEGPRAFIETNVLGTFNLLDQTRKYWATLTPDKKKSFRYLQVSTDEVYGSLGDTGKFNETLPYQPNSPYSASKAAGDHLARAWFHTYGLPTVTTNCSNNYGPRQFPEKLIPLMIKNCLERKNLPVYGNGKNVRDWIHVDDHSYGVYLALTKGQPGKTYCFGGNSEYSNIDVVNTITKLLDGIKPRDDGKSYTEQIVFVADRLGHDWRYAIDDSLAQRELGFKRSYLNFEDGLKSTILWYLENQAWVKKVISGKGAK